jgi:hypothetical protein
LRWKHEQQQNNTHKMDALEAALTRIILNPKYHAPLMLVKAMRNGIVYGTKVRFPHALV